MFKKYLSVTVALFFCVFVAKALAAPQPVVHYTFDELGELSQMLLGMGMTGHPKET